MKITEKAKAIAKTTGTFVSEKSKEAYKSQFVQTTLEKTKKIFVKEKS